MTDDDDTTELAAQLLLRDTIEVELVVDADTARGLSDEQLERVLGRQARMEVREELERQGDE